MIKRIMITAILLAISFSLLLLPNASNQNFQDQMALFNLQSLPDADLRHIAEQEWEAGRKDAAIGILDYMLEENMGDASSARILKEQYLEKIRADNSLTGRIMAAGYGFATGRVEDTSSLIGSAAADFFIYGDLRDITRELVFEDEADTLTVALSSAGLLTTMFPPADAATSIMKALKKMSVLSDSMLTMLRTVLKGFNNLGDLGKIDKVKDFFIPFHELFKKVGSWTNFMSITRNCKNVDQVKMLSKLLSLAPDNAKKTSRIFSVAGNQGSELVEQVLNRIGKHGQKGMDDFYAALRKGPAGLRFVANHPTLTVRSLKNANKAFPMILNEALGTWNEFARANITASLFLKYGLFAGLILITSILSLPIFKPLLHSPANSSRFSSWPTIVTISVVIAVVMFTLAGFNNSAELNVPSDNLSNSNPQHIVPSNEVLPGQLIPMLMGALFINLFIHGFIIRITAKKVEAITSSSAPVDAKFAMIENLDIFFDLPMYVGLGMTILAFIGITITGGESARMLAYTSTFCGIASSAFLRLTSLRQAKEELLAITFADGMRGKI